MNLFHMPSSFSNLFHAFAMQDLDAEGSDLEDDQPDDPHADPLLADIEAEARMEAEQDVPACDMLQTELKKVPGTEDLRSTLQAPPCDDIPEDPSFSPPNTLHDVMCKGLTEQRWDRLWRLSMSLRHWRGGSDRLWIPNPRSSRRASSKLSWHQFLDISRQCVMMHSAYFCFISP